LFVGSIITEPAAMTICASLLARKFYSLKPSKGLAYSTLGLLFVAISVGGTLTNFAAPPVLMVADAWGWTTNHMLTQFGWKAMLGIVTATLAYYIYFRKELHALGRGALLRDPTEPKQLPIPLWVTVGHVLFMVSTVVNAHHPKQLIFTILFFLAFVEVTEDFQRNFSLRSPVLVGLFLAGLVIHGGLQQWWIAPVLGGLDELPLALGATALTAFNDNAAVTYLCTLVPSMTEGMKYAAVAGAVTGGGLTVIANAPNPAGQSILDKHFEDGISSLGLLAGALLPTLVVLVCFLSFR
jgi:Na+/H+ antiporter NhaD/arsenite permease-like protein